LSLSEEDIRGWVGWADVVLNDLSPKTSGIKWLDHQRSLDLNFRALEVAGWLLKRGGHFLIKIFEGEGTRDFSRKMGEDFEAVRIHKPKSSRSESRENYFLGTAFKGIRPDSALSEKR
jgi:23S rRNA (uridine2552-2'-O)-methyltransferase